MAIWTLQVYQDYHLPISPRDITTDELRFFYEPLVEGLIELQRLQEKNKWQANTQ